MKKVCVDQDKCIGCGACVAISPENFDFNEEGFSEVFNESLNEKTMEAVEACPVFAISIEESETCECNDECNCGCKDDEECTCEDDCDCNDDCCCDDCNCGCKDGKECTCEDDCDCNDKCCCEETELK